MNEGIATGLLCGLCHSICYLASRFYVVSTGGSALRLLLLAQVPMGVVAIPLMLLLWPETWPESSRVVGALAQSIGLYLSGQYFMIEATRHTQPSRVSPLLGMKVVLMGVVCMLFFGEVISRIQWFAICLCSAGAVSLGVAGGKISFLAGATIFMAALSYVFSDIGISHLVQSFLDCGMGLLTASLFSMGLTYSLMSLGTVCALPFSYGFRGIVSEGRYVLSFAGCWMGAMGFYYATLGMLGPVYGAVLQASRGMMSVVLGIVVSHLGYMAMEEKLGRGVFLIRLFAAGAMFASIWLFGAHL